MLLISGEKTKDSGLTYDDSPFGTRIVRFASPREPARASQARESREEISSIISSFFVRDLREDGKEERW
jgi:hypothetical protein